MRKEAARKKNTGQNRPKGTGYHYLLVDHPNDRMLLIEILAKGLKRKKASSNKRSNPLVDKLRRIFDEEKPRDISESQSNSVFFWPDTGFFNLHSKIPPLPARLSKQARVADAALFQDALNTVGFAEAFHKEVNESKLRTLARRYWSGSLSLEMFELYYRPLQYWKHTSINRQLGFELPKAIVKKLKEKQWVRIPGAPVTLPRIIKSPEILVRHDVRIKPSELAAFWKKNYPAFSLSESQPATTRKK